MGSIMLAIAWAVAGAVFYKVALSITSIGRYSMFAQRVVFHCLTLMGAVVEDLAFMRELKYLQSAKSGMTEEQIEFIKKVDDESLNKWKQNSINLFKSSFPGMLSNIVKFNTWDQAMKELKRLNKTI